MTIQPRTIEELAEAIRAAREPIAGVNLSALNSVLEHTPEDMTATVECGMTLASFQTALRRHRQWVPLDPALPDETTIGEMLANDLSGPRRLGYGTAREYVIGMRVVLGSGEIIRNGGKVVKNVAGYDLCRLFIGARNTLAIIVEATFKLRPVPEREVILQARCGSVAEAREFAARLSEPVALDLHNAGERLTLVAAFAGAGEDVEEQEAQAREAGLREPGNFEYDAAARKLRKHSVLPSEIWNVLDKLAGPVVARVGNGILYCEGDPVKRTDLPRELMARVKKAYDPKGILPEY